MYKLKLLRPSSFENISHFKTVVKPFSMSKGSPSHAMLLSTEEQHGRTNHGMEYTAADFGIDDSSYDRGSIISSTGTPVLPELSSASSFEDPPLDFSSDVSGFTRESFATSAKLQPGEWYREHS